jgi:hypothetical protein
VRADDSLIVRHFCHHGEALAARGLDRAQRRHELRLGARQDRHRSRCEDKRHGAADAPPAAGDEHNTAAVIR